MFKKKKASLLQDIKISLDATGYKTSENTIYLILKNEGFARLPKRNKEQKLHLEERYIKS